MIRVIGIDADEESCAWEVTGADAAYLARALCQLGWRWATLREDGQDIGGVRLDASLRKRVPWARTSEDGTTAQLER
jgi:hypothetical protein